MKSYIKSFALRPKFLAGAGYSIFNLLTYGVAYAQRLPDVGISTISDVRFSVICVLAGFMFWVLTALTVLFVVIAAYKYLTSNGEEEKVSSATKTLTYAAVAIAVGLLAKGFPSIVGDLFSYAPRSC